MGRAFTLAAGIVLLTAAGIAFLMILVLFIPSDETDADTWLGAAILLGAALLAGGMADLLLIRGVRPPAPRLAVTASERPAARRPVSARAAPIPVAPAPRAATAAIGVPVRGGVDYGSTLGPALQEVGSQLFGVAGGLLADLLTAFLQRRRRARGAPAPPVATGRRGWSAQLRAGLRAAAALVLVMLWVGAIGGLEGIFEAFVDAPATVWNNLTAEPDFQVALGVCVTVAVVGGVVMSRLRRG